MHITIAERLHPFSHLPGTATIIPGAGYQVWITPCKVRLFDLKQKDPILLAEFEISLKGPIEEFTIINDLEKGRMSVSGHSEKGWFRYHLTSGKDCKAIHLLADRVPSDGLLIKNGEERLLNTNENWDIIHTNTPFEPYQIPSIDRLSLGNHKKQDWDLIKRRIDLTEILPLLHRLGQLIPSVPFSNACGGALDLLEECKKNIFSETPDKGEKKWISFLMGALKSMLVPQLEDSNFQGLVERPFSGDCSPLILLKEAGLLIRKLFLQEYELELKILPHLFPSLHCGRLVNVKCSDRGFISLEWTKKEIRRLIFYSMKDQEWTMRFRSNIKDFRLRENEREKGKRIESGHPLFFKKECVYFLDNFQS